MVLTSFGKSGEKTMRDLIVAYYQSQGIQLDEAVIDTITADLSGVIMAKLAMRVSENMSPVEATALAGAVQEGRVDDVIRMVVNTYDTQEAFQKDFSNICRVVVADYQAVA